MSLKLNKADMPSPIKPGDKLYYQGNLTYMSGRLHELVVERVEGNKIFFNSCANSCYQCLKINPHWCTSLIGHVGKPCIFCGQFAYEDKSTK